MCDFLVNLDDFLSWFARFFTKVVVSTKYVPLVHELKEVKFVKLVRLLIVKYDRTTSLNLYHFCAIRKV
jgi:hypothetical protein